MYIYTLNYYVSGKTTVCDKWYKLVATQSDGSAFGKQTKWEKKEGEGEDDDDDDE